MWGTQHVHKHALWLAGFRPFFLLACLSGAILPLMWVLMLGGAVSPASTFPDMPVRWHAHEMFYGFGWAALGGFLLTASKNWVGVRGWHGGALIFLVALWCLDRVAMLLGGQWPVPVFWLAASLFPIVMIGMLLHTLFWQRVRDDGNDNYYFWIILPLFLPAKLLLIGGDYYLLGWSMSLALFRVAFLLMIERTQVQFMRMAFQVDILRDARLDHAIKSLAIVLVFVEWLPTALAGALEWLLASLLLGRLLFWHPLRAMTRLDIGVMYLGYLLLTAQLAVSGLGRFVELPWLGSVTVHLFALGTLGLILPAMIVRISKGHTGRPVVFECFDKAVLWLLIFGLVARVLAPQWVPQRYTLWLHLASFCWLLAFGVLVWRYAPFWLRPRVDGKVH